MDQEAVTERYSTSRGIAYRATPIDPTRPTLLFLHGLSGSLSAWHPYESFFTASANLVIPDLRGHGRSKRWPHERDYTVPEYARDLIELLEELGVARVTIVAHSFAATVVVELARQYASRIASVILLAPAYKTSTLARTRLTQPFLALGSLILCVLPRLAGSRRVDYSRFPNDADWDLRRIANDLHATGLHSYTWSLRELYRYPDSAWSALAPFPTLIVHGTRDTFVPFSHSADLAHTLPHATFETWEGVNHMLVMNEPRRVSERILSFMGLASHE